jgi:hypothetical protein
MREGAEVARGAPEHLRQDTALSVRRLDRDQCSEMHHDAILTAMNPSPRRVRDGPWNRMAPVEPAVRRSAQELE